MATCSNFHGARSRSSNALVIGRALLAVAALLLVDRCQASWVPNVRKGHATYFPAIDAGSCGFGKTDNLPTKRFIAAVSDQVPGYQDMCGSCFEVQCDDTRNVFDHFGTGYYGAKWACKKKNKKIVVMITDECTAVGNSKWCKDSRFTHLDLSEEAYRSLADVSKSGVMAIKFKSVACPGTSTSGKNRRRRVVKNKPARKCKKMVGPWQQCGGRATTVWANQVDKPWPGHCCKTLLSCQRSSQYYWSCKR